MKVSTVKCTARRLIITKFLFLLQIWFPDPHYLSRVKEELAARGIYCFWVLASYSRRSGCFIAFLHPTPMKQKRPAASTVQGWECRRWEIKNRITDRQTQIQSRSLTLRFWFWEITFRHRNEVDKCVMKPRWKQVKCEFNLYLLYEENDMMCIW